MVKIIIGKECLGGHKCAKCAKLCPLGVFVVVPEDKFEEGKKPKEYGIRSYYRELCNGCNICVDNCPVKCIKIFP